MTRMTNASAPVHVSTRLVLFVGAVGAVAFALGFGTGSLELAHFGTPSGVALYAAQIGMGAPAHAAVAATEATYLPAVLHADAPEAESPMPQF